jgi:hypothetical protein
LAKGPKVRTLFKVFSILICTYALGCQHSGIVIKDTPLSLSEIRRNVVLVVGEPRTMSPNGYQITSQYYDRKEKIIERPNDVRERFAIIVNIIGDRRPYDIQVLASVEIRTSEGYEVAGQDDVMAQVWADKIKKALHESRDKRNVIDDFKAF